MEAVHENDQRLRQGDAMSDSYRAYCEAREEGERKFSAENVISAMRTSKHKRALKAASAACNTAKLREARTCENCTHNKFINNHHVCVKLGFLPDNDLVCEHWSGAEYTVNQPFAHKEVVAWSIIDKQRD